jgi:hypothetical protein
VKARGDQIRVMTPALVAKLPMAPSMVAGVAP